MAEVCVFCKEQIESLCPPRLEDNKMFMFEILMEQTSFDKDLFIHSPICDDCDNTILNFFNFKSNFMETEDEFINYMNSDNKVNLYDVLVKTFKIKKFDNENVPIKVCRVCFKATQVKDYKEIKSVESKLATMITTCLPEFNIKLTDHTYLCTDCYTIILQYYHFLLCCSELTKPKKGDKVEADPVSIKTLSLEGAATLSEKNISSETLTKNLATSETLISLSGKRERSKDSSSDPFMLINKKRKVEENVSVTEPSKSSVPPSPSSNLPCIPAVSQKRRPGRPRKLETAPNHKKLKQQLVIDSATVEAGVHYECQICPEILYTFKCLKQHLTGHEKEKTFFCWQCGYVCYHFGALRKHYEGHGTSLFKKVKENNGTSTVGDLSEISQNNKERTPRAEIDDSLVSVKRTDIYTPPDVKNARKKLAETRQSTRLANSTSSITLTSRSRSVESDNSKRLKSSELMVTGQCFECQICPGIFNSALDWTHHISFHRIQSPIHCWRCGKWFRRLNNLKVHLEEHDVFFYYKLIPVEGTQISKTEATRTSGSDKQTAREELPTSSKSPEAVSTVPCIQCEQVFDQIEEYMDHVCTFKPKQTDTPEENVEEHGFGCGHCTAIFDNLDDLDEHNCIPTKSTNNSSTKIGEESSQTYTIQTSTITNKNLKISLEPEATSRNVDADYECSYCLLTFTTIKLLDTHICKEDPESTVSENPTSEQTAPDNEAYENAAPAVVEVKKECLFECAYCVSLFETGLELKQHKCSKAPVSDSTEAVSVDTEAVFDDAVSDGTIQVIKSDAEDNVCLAPNSEQNVKVSANIEKANKIPDDGFKSSNVENRGKPREMSNTKKKNVINKIAEMFGVKIVEAKHRKKDQNLKETYNCIGCDFTGTDHKDLMFHFGFCDKVYRCNYCTYGTNLSGKLEIHSWSAHDILIFVCSHCAFVSSMEENFAAHVVTHKKNDRNDVSDEVIYASDEEESSETIPNELCDFLTPRNGSVSISERVSKTINKQNNTDSKQQVAEVGNLIDLTDVTMNVYQTNTTNVEEKKDTMSVIDMDDSEAFCIPRGEPEVTTDDTGAMPTSEKGPLATEPVWLVKSRSVKEHILQPTADEALTADDSSDALNQSELIPDRIITKEPTNSKLEPLKDICLEVSKSSTDNDAGDVINCDSDSDSEFVESSETRISNVAVHAEEVVTISASEASKLISEGVPVIRGASLVSSCAIQADGSIDQLSTIQVVSEQDISKVTDKEKKSTENKEEKQPNSLNTDNRQPESTRSTKKNDLEKLFTKISSKQADTSKNNNNSKSIKSKSNVNSTVVREIEDDSANSDGSSFFVTDNEDSDSDEPKFKSTASTTICSSKPKHYTVEKQFLPANIDEEVLISDDDDDDKIKKELPKQILSNTDVLERNKKTHDGQSTKNNLLNPAFSGLNSYKKLPKKILPKKLNNVHNLLSNSKKTLTVGCEDSFVISDDDGEIPLQHQSITEDRSQIKETAKNSASIPTCSRALSDGSIQKSVPMEARNIATNARVLEAAAKKPAALTRYTKASGSQSKFLSTSVQDEIAKKIVSETDEDDDKELEAVLSDDDCVFVSDESKNLGSSSVAGDKSPRDRAPPNALLLFMSKVKHDIKRKYPDLKWAAQKNIMMDAWRCMSNEDKWPFKEEARLHRLLFKREHPEHHLRSKKKMAMQPKTNKKAGEAQFKRAVVTYLVMNTSIFETAKRYGINPKTFQRKLQKLRETNTTEEILDLMKNSDDHILNDSTVTKAPPVQIQKHPLVPKSEDTSDAIVLD